MNPPSLASRAPQRALYARHAMGAAALAFVAGLPVRSAHAAPISSAGQARHPVCADARYAPSAGSRPLLLRDSRLPA